ncbi:hypothetical protein M431DRAFT_229092 [Trichoderma harzianum CBS 226.95]|uniref:Uncharacterized protein n=1 Tax=Trichoderma harzianum CBS 226.95 TaxID=983964 RepID=A0A2T4A491_TRIHA|nr:hypothetical protein M431DRAFT_229092 [Trichoderma harzianum CBS 226.95]PTB51866.1 hypothetical protein M431DRAFT_229092 [Trichoderma harzianum CBS 226.95]
MQCQQISTWAISTAKQGVQIASPYASSCHLPYLSGSARWIAARSGVSMLPTAYTRTPKTLLRLLGLFSCKLPLSPLYVCMYGIFFFFFRSKMPICVLAADHTRHIWGVRVRLSQSTEQNEYRISKRPKIHEPMRQTDTTRQATYQVL